MSTREFTDEHRQKISQAMMGHVVGEETKRRISESVTQTMSDPKLKTQISAKVSSVLIGHEVSEETKQRISETMAKVMSNPELRTRISEANTGQVRDGETRRRMSEAKVGGQSPRFGAVLSEETKKQISESLKENWKDPEFVKRYSEAHQRKPNESELRLQAILDRHSPNEWKYTGDGTFWIEGRNPDFVNINGKKQVIEMFGIYWHDPILFPHRLTEEELIAHYIRYGFDCLVLWEHEAWDEEETVNKIEFAFGG